MPFDGRQYGAPILVGPIRYHPEAVATGFALSEILLSSYAAARSNERILFQTMWSRDLQDIARLSETNTRQPGASTPLQLLECERTLPEDVTHAIVETHFQAWTTDARGVQVKHRLTIDNGTTTASGELDTEVAFHASTPGLSNRGALHTRLAAFFSPVGDSHPWEYRSILEVPVDAGHPGSLCTFQLEAELSPELYSTYRPGIAVAWWAVRG
tara:strand:+ start:678 stop:1316 length:639 start_codon:yes stop_codon:yes gene_type:complete